MIQVILTIIIFIIAFDLGREWEKLDQKYTEEKIKEKATSIYTNPFTDKIHIKDNSGCITMSHKENVDSGITTIYDKDIPITYT